MAIPQSRGTARKTPRGSQSVRKGGAPRTNNGIGQAVRNARQGIARNARAMERAREGSYRGLDTAIGRLYDRLRSTDRGLRRHLTRGNARDLTRILDAESRSRMANKRIRHVIEGGVDDYGDLNGMLHDTLTRDARRVRQDVFESGRLATATTGAANALAKTSEQAVRQTMASAREQEGAANMVAAEALSRRTTEDLALIAQQEHEIATMQLQARIQAGQAQQEFKNAKKLEAFRQKLVTGGLDPQNKQMVTEAVHNLGQVGALVMAHKDEMDAGQLAQYIFALPAFANLSFEEQTAVQTIIDRLTSNDSPGVDDAAQEVIDVIRSVSGWKNLGQGKRDNLKDWAKDAVTGYLSEETVKAAEKNGVTPADPTGGPVGTKFDAYRAAVVKEADGNLQQVEEYRDTAIEWFRQNAEAALLKALPDLNKERVADIIDEIVDGEHWSNHIDVVNRRLPLNAQLAIAAVFKRMPTEARNVFEFGAGQGIID